MQRSICIQDGQEFTGSSFSESVLRMQRLASCLLVCFCATGSVLAAETATTNSAAKPRAEYKVLVTASRLYSITNTPGYQPVMQQVTSKIPMKASETPRSISTLTPEILDDMHVYDTKEAVAYLPGVYNFSDSAVLYDYGSFYIRGFKQTFAYRDGARMWGNAPVDLNTVERVDVVKGSDSVNFGQMEGVGGVMNYTTKGAKMTRFGGNVAGSYENTGRTRETFDLGGAVSSNSAVRLFGTFQDGETYRTLGQGNNRLYTIGGAYLIGNDDTTLDIRLVYTHSERILDQGVPLVNGKPYGKISQFYGDPDLRGSNRDEFNGTAILTHHFNENWTYHARVISHFFRNRIDCLRGPTLQYTDGAFNGNVVGTLDDCSCDMQDGNFDQDVTYETEYRDLVKNTVAIGLDARQRAYQWHAKNWSKYSYNIYTHRLTKTAATKYTDYVNYQDLYYLSPYLQDHAAFFDDLVHLTFGGRVDNLWQNNRTGANGTSTHTKLDSYDDALTGNAGLLFKPLPHFNPYVSICNSFNPQNVGRYKDGGDRIAPERGVQYEAGIKSPWFNDRLQAGLAGYEIDKSNIARYDTASDSYYTIGKARSRGVEASLQGRVTDNLDVIASYSHTDTRTRVSTSTSAVAGARFAGVPEDSGAIWAVAHHNDDDWLPGLRYGFGYEAMSSRFYDDKESGSTPGYFLLSAMVGYTYKLSKETALSLQLNLHNLLNRDYYQSVNNATWAMPGAPFGGVLTAKLIF